MLKKKIFRQNHLKQAFSLIELVLYLAIFSIFSLISFAFLSRGYKDLVFFQKEMKKDIRNSLSIDILIRDLISADSSLKLWVEESAGIGSDFSGIKKIVFRKNGKEVGWSSRKDGLFRTTGSYDFSKRKWTKKNVARINVQSLKLSMKKMPDKKKENVIGVNVFKNNELICFIRLRNGVINNAEK